VWPRLSLRRLPARLLLDQADDDETGPAPPVSPPADPTRHAARSASRDCFNGAAAPLGGPTARRRLLRQSGPDKLSRRVVPAVHRARFRQARSWPGSPGTGPGTCRRSGAGRRTCPQAPTAPLATRCRTFRASLPQKLHLACEPGGSSRIDPSARSSTLAPAASRVTCITQRSQMNTPGPAISLAHTSRGRPQNEHGPTGPDSSCGSRRHRRRRVGSAASSMIWWTRWWLRRNAAAISRSDPPAACSRRIAW
jgi:hypothetical protein